jgi:hypothetical protein
MGYWAIIGLAVLALAAAVPLWIESRPRHAYEHTDSSRDMPDIQKTKVARTRRIELDGVCAASMEVLFVLDPNFYLCWESVQLNELSRSSLIPWLLELKEFATQTRSYPSGDFLEVHPALCSLIQMTAILGPEVLRPNFGETYPCRATEMPLICSCQTTLIVQQRCNTMRASTLPIWSGLG